MTITDASTAENIDRINDLRQELSEALGAASGWLVKADRALTQLSSDRVFDVEFAEADGIPGQLLQGARIYLDGLVADVERVMAYDTSSPDLSNAEEAVERARGLALSAYLGALARATNQLTPIALANRPAA